MKLYNRLTGYRNRRNVHAINGQRCFILAGTENEIGKSVDICQRGNFSTCGAITRRTIGLDHRSRSGQTRPHAFSTISWITFVQLHHPPTHNKDEVKFFFAQNFDGKQRMNNFYTIFFFFSTINSGGTGRNHPIVLTGNTKGTDTWNTCSSRVCVGIRDPLTNKPEPNCINLH